MDKAVIDDAVAVVVTGVFPVLEPDGGAALVNDCAIDGDFVTAAVHVDGFAHIFGAVFPDGAIDDDISAGAYFDSVGTGFEVAKIFDGLIGDGGVFVDMDSGIITNADGVFIADAV